MKNEQEKQINTAIIVVKFTILLFIVVGIPMIFFFCFPNLIHKVDSVEKINAILEQNRLTSAFIYIGMQICQVILFFAPGQLVQMAGGYAFPLPLAILLTFVGVGLGTIIVFNMARLFGKDMVFMLIGRERSIKFIEMMRSKKAFVMIILLFLFPGLPKDALDYIAGVSGLRIIPFTLLSMSARLPALIASLVFGDMFSKGYYNGMIIIGGIVFVTAIICLIFRKNLTNFIDRIYRKSL